MQTALLATAAGLLLLGIYAVIIAPRRLRIIELDVPIPGLAAEFDGYRIGVLSDLHQAFLPGLSHTRRAVHEIQRRTPDIIALLGDYGVSFESSARASRRLYPDELRTLTPVLRGLYAPDGVVGLIGNHDYYYDGTAVAEWLRTTGVRVLRNAHVTVVRGRARLTIGGVDDALESVSDIDAAFAGADPRAPRILLAHNPDSVLCPGEPPPPALVLAGHTHGGQVALPFYGPPVQFARICTRHAAQGWIENDYAPMFVSAGVGSQIPLRFLTTPDVVLVRLHAVPAEA
ncbi:MAG TPA: metallophosphoesterase [Gemmatimonadaceae bacterium]|nr:metallophosphoesterase [Gemmatimonadaceae bacterium]